MHEDLVVTFNVTDFLVLVGTFAVLFTAVYTVAKVFAWAIKTAYRDFMTVVRRNKTVIAE